MPVTPYDPLYPKAPRYTRISWLYLLIEPELWVIEVLHCGNMDCRLLSTCRKLFCDLDLDPMTFVYELDSYSLEIHWMCKYELPTSRLLKVIV